MCLSQIEKKIGTKQMRTYLFKNSHTKILILISMPWIFPIHLKIFLKSSWPFLAVNVLSWARTSLCMRMCMVRGPVWLQELQLTWFSWLLWHFDKQASECQLVTYHYLVYSHSVIFELSPQFFPHILPQIPCTILTFYAVFGFFP